MTVDEMLKEIDAIEEIIAIATADSRANRNDAGLRGVVRAVKRQNALLRTFVTPVAEVDPDAADNQ